MPATFSYEVSEWDTVAGGVWVSYASDTVKNALTVKLDFIENSALQIIATNTEAGVYYDKTITPDYYDLGMSDLQFTIKGRVY